MENELYHHGILGQKWGHQNGPPYPLKSSQKSYAEKRLDKYKHRETEKVKARSNYQIYKTEKLSSKNKIKDSEEKIADIKSQEKQLLKSISKMTVSEMRKEKALRAEGIVATGVPIGLINTFLSTNFAIPITAAYIVADPYRTDKFVNKRRLKNNQ